VFDQLLYCFSYWVDKFYQQLFYSYVPSCNNYDSRNPTNLSFLSYLVFFTDCIIGALLQNLFLLQNNEWSAMLYIIETQKDRRVEQILNDFNTESLRNTLSQTPFSDKKLTFRKDEIKKAKCQKIWLVMGNIFIFVYYGLVFFEYQAGYYLLISQYILSFIFLSIDFFRLYFQLKKRHFFEFQRIKRQMREYFFLFAVLFVFLLKQYIVDVKSFAADGTLSFQGKI
jgi:hypothetical protein